MTYPGEFDDELADTIERKIMRDPRRKFVDRSKKKPKTNNNRKFLEKVSGEEKLLKELEKERYGKIK